MPRTAAGGASRSHLKGGAAYKAGALVLRVVSPGVGVWSVPDFDTPLAGYSIQASVMINEGSADSVVGFVLDYESDTSFLTLGVTVGGEWRLLRYDNGTWTDRTPDDDAASAARESTGTTFVLRADVAGDVLTVQIDDHVLGEVVLGDTLSGSEFGVFARAGRGTIDVSFDDVMVSELIEDNKS